MTTIRTQVIIIGGGPAGMLLSHILDAEGIDSIVLERSTREHVLKRIRAGVLEADTVQLLRDYGLAERLDAEGSVHEGVGIAWAGREHFTIDILKHTGKSLYAFGQTAITEELYKARDAAGGTIVEEAADISLLDIDSARPYVTYKKDGENHRVDAEHVAGCDGFHGASRQAIPPSVICTYEKAYPFGWLGIMSRTPPVGEIIYANHPDGFAMCSQRNPMLSRYYVQCPAEDAVEDWSDDRFWDTLTTRLGPDIAAQIQTGPSIEKSIAPLRSFVAEPMRHGALFLVGDAAHIVPPTGAKGLNLAVSDVYYLSRALIEHHKHGTSDMLDAYSQTALKRVWASTKFSWRFTALLHRFPGQSDFDQRMQETELAFLRDNEIEQASIAHQYVGLAY